MPRLRTTKTTETKKNLSSRSIAWTMPMKDITAGQWAGGKGRNKGTRREDLTDNNTKLFREGQCWPRPKQQAFKSACGGMSSAEKMSAIPNGRRVKMTAKTTFAFCRLQFFVLCFFAFEISSLRFLGVIYIGFFCAVCVFRTCCQK